MTELIATDIRSGYGGIEAVRGVSLTVQPGEVVTIIGSNGAGKSTLLKTLVGLVPAMEGRISIGGRDLTNLSVEDRVRAGLVLVPEGRHVFNGLTVKENLLLGAYHRRRAFDRKGEIAKVYEVFPILAERENQPAGTLSGGQQQMLAIGRGLMSDPKIMLLDEPSLGLSPQATEQVAERLATVSRGGTTMIVVEQNAEMAFALADRGYVLVRGQVVAAASVAELRLDPRVHEAYLGTSTASDASPSR
ncbi:ABC transporter ATP-binding protein [Pseudonocardia hispaniensis]|uniref:ABC transporter ATP-binding protein n=1 Tax=Pseudonocardia hispaniensis TaxID=904933 RepID=A0ABW1IZ07_9PSEU